MYGLEVMSLNNLYIQKIFMDGKGTDIGSVGGISGTTQENKYLFNLPVVKNLMQGGELKLTSPVTFLVGENGSGKSTLLEAIAVNYGFNPEGGSRNFNFNTYSSHSKLSNYLKLWKGAIRAKDGFFLRAESFYNVASYIEELDQIVATSPTIKQSYGGKSLHEQSHGESFISLICNRFGGNGIYILDEPEAALSPSRQMSLLAKIGELVKNNSQFIIATHSPILMAYPNAQIFSLDDIPQKGDIEQVEYKNTRHYQLTKRFLDNPEKMLKLLLEDENNTNTDK